jgi:hypothetical protein
VSSLRVALVYAWARFRAKPAQAAVAGAAIGVAVAALALLVLLPTVAGDLLLRRTLSDLAPSERSVAVVVAPEAQPDAAVRDRIDVGLRARLAVPGLGPLRRLVEFRSLAMANGSLFRLGGAQDLSTMVALVDGRLPASCAPTLCEIVAVGSSIPLGAKPLPDLVVVGHVTQTDPVPFTGGLLPNTEEALLLADGVGPVNEVESLTLIRRIDAWVATILPNRVSRPALTRILVTLPKAAAEIPFIGVTISAPDALLNTALKRADVAGRGLAVPIGQTLVLLFGMTTLVGLGLRNRHLLAADRLARRGADRAVTRAFDGVSSLLAVMAGVVIGVLLAAAGSVLLLDQLRLPVGPTLRAAWRASSVVGFVVALAVVWLVTTVFLRIRRGDTPVRAKRVAVSDLVLLMTVSFTALLLARGTSSAGGLAERSDPVLWALPVLTAVALACLVIRVVPGLLAVAARLLPTRSPLARVALADATRRPLRPLAAASIIATAVAFGSFAVSYRSTLLLGADEQAAFSVPYDMRLDVARELVRPSQLTPTAAWASVVPGTVATDALRRGVTLRRSGTTGDVVDILGLVPSTLTSLRSPRADYGPAPAEVAQLLTAPAPTPVGTIISPAAASLRVNLDGSLAEAEIALVLERRDGTWHEEKTVLDAQGRPTLALEDADRGGRFIGFRVGQPSYTTERIEHHVQEGNSFAPAAAVAIEVHFVEVINADESVQRLPLNAGSFASRQAVIEARPDGSLRIAIALQGSAALVLPAASAEPLPALVDPVTASAASNGVLTVDLGGSPFDLRVVATAARFPTLSPRFIVTDQAQLRQHLDLAQPGVGQASEVWLATDTPAHEAQLAAALAKSPYSALLVERRTTKRRLLRQDPLSELTLAVLIGSAVLAALLAAGALALNAVAERAEDESFHRALALEGATDGVMNRLVATRAFGLALAAIPVGLIGGAFLVSVIVRAVRIAATGDTPLPPLRLVLPGTVLALALAGLVALLALTAVLASKLTKPPARQDLLRGRP